ncbi:hypothetical protein BS47DRAFT_1484927 [Hydnum rufescens UP504]|uniref:Uncharacterized protein n=1 Tax=Hydnum rufescens UP504 TaxID=1448309 RepID=A0A9P6AZH6_9AGAM|nr:hypothetical protein BS47DRAFT_1484927 [Hydnum rufescens UP504]
MVPYKEGKFKATVLIREHIPPKQGLALARQAPSSKDLTMGSRIQHFIRYTSSPAGPRADTPPPNRDRGSQPSPTSQYDPAAQHGPNAWPGPAAQQGPPVRQGPNNQPTSTADQGLLKLSLGDGGHATHPTLAIGGPGNQLGPRGAGRDTLGLVTALKTKGQPLSAAIGGEGGGADLPSLITLLREVKDQKNVDIHFGNGGNATSGNAAGGNATSRPN